MTPSNPAEWPMSTWILAISISIAGGFANWLRAVSDPDRRTQVFSITELLGELFISGFSGMVVFMYSESQGWPLSMCAAYAGAAGHMSGILIALVESKIKSAIVTKRRKTSDDK